MAEAATNEVPRQSTHDQRRSIPTPVKVIAVFYLLMSVVNLCHFFSYLSVVPIFALPALLKALLGIAAAIGLLKLRDGWRVFTLIVTGLGLLSLPVYALVIFFSSDFALFASRLLLLPKLPGIDSWIVLELVVALMLVMCLWILRTLLRPEVARAFEARE